MIKTYSLLTFYILTLFCNAQNHVDALRYSNESLWGSARYAAMAGAFGSLGANLNTASFNPAGIATYTTNEFSINIDFLRLETESQYYENNDFNSKSNFSVPNINYISANIFDPKDVGDWNRFNFSIGYNKLDDYNQNISVQAEQNENSFSDLILNSAQGTSFDELNSFYELLAFNTYLIDTIGGLNSYISPIDGEMNKIQSYISIESGSKNEFYVSFGSAYQDKLFIGATIGFPSINYNQIINIREEEFTGIEDEIVNLEYFDYNTNLNVSGSGINLKLGFIYKLENKIRYGFALHTPTYFKINEEYWSSMNTSFNNNDEYYAESSFGFFDYQLNTPFKVINSLSYILKKKAILSIDYEYLDYSSANFNSDFYNFNNANAKINKYYTYSSNIKIGSELKIHSQINLRAGYAIYGSPFRNDINNASQEFITSGFGLNVNQYSFDFALINSISDEILYIYSDNPSSISSSRTSLLISAGFKF